MNDIVKPESVKRIADLEIMRFYTPGFCQRKSLRVPEFNLQDSRFLTLMVRSFSTEFLYRKAAASFMLTLQQTQPWGFSFWQYTMG